MESNNISAEIAEHGHNSPGCSLKSDGGPCYSQLPKNRNIRQYMTSQNPCEKLVNKPEPFPSLLESAEQERREKRKLEFIRQSICGLIA